MRKLIVGSLIPVVALLAVAGCAQGTKPQTMAANVEPAVQASETVDSADAPAIATPAMLPLSYSWANEYKGFVSTPVEILRKGRAACQQRDFEVATIGTIGLKGDMVTVTFICRGDVE